jgi:hypothetical protein
MVIDETVYIRKIGENKVISTYSLANPNIRFIIKDGRNDVKQGEIKKLRMITSNIKTSNENDRIFLLFIDDYKVIE